jgi:hypothetical protein
MRGRANPVARELTRRPALLGLSRTKETSMLVFFLFTAVGTLPAVVLLVQMFRRDDPMLGAWAHIWLCLGGIAGAAYGVLHSTG